MPDDETQQEEVEIEDVVGGFLRGFGETFRDWWARLGSPALGVGLDGAETPYRPPPGDFDVPLPGYTIIERAPPEFATANPETEWQFNTLKNLLGAEPFRIDATDAGKYVNLWAQRYWEGHGNWVDQPPDAEGRPQDPVWEGEWPDITDIYRDEGFWAGAIKIPTGAYLLPSMFTVVEPDGTRTLMDNRLSTGPLPIDAPGVQSLFNVSLARGGIGPWETGIPREDVALPEIPREFLDMLMETFADRGSGYGRAPIKFDRDQITESIRQAWHGLLLDDPVNPGNMADQYINQATSFYHEGGQLDLQTWTLNQIRESDRYQTLYKRKPNWMDEDEYLGRRQQIVQQFGFRPEVEKTQTEIGMETGVGLDALSQRLLGTREYMVANKGAFSQSFANMFAGLGSISRS